MDLGYNLRLEQQQRLMMTPELRQAIKILQLSSVELTDYVNEMILENPLIEINEEAIDPNLGKKESLPDWGEYLRGTRDLPERNLPKEVKAEFPFENLVSKGVDLHEYLLSQLGYLSLNELQCKAARYLIGNLDSSGYLAVTIEQAANDLKIASKQVEEALSIVQTFDPPGIGARTLCECILIQLKQKDINNQELHDIVVNHLENIASGRLNRVAQALDIPVSKVQELADIIKSLNPKPGASFGNGSDTRYIVPDVTVERVDNEYIILISDSRIPHLTINNTYRAILDSSQGTDDRTRSFVENKLNQALWLMRSIEQRRMTIYQVTSALVDLQRPFFDHGMKYLKPLTLKQLAEQINVHESTVSRATSNKYLQTPHGTFEYKFFFNPGLNTTDRGDNACSEIIKRTLQEIVKSEDTAKPYSDQRLADMMQERGVLIARRTVTKYREELGIPNTVYRRRY